jgi:putative tryptophan/tyrosine transport system substrate-binding protein
MRRREFVVGLAASVPLLREVERAKAQTKVHRIGYLGNRQNAAIWQAFLDGLREHGWVDRHNIEVQARFAEGRAERYAELALELVSLKMDVIVASAPPAVRAVQQATRTTPIIMTAVADPVAMGFVRSLGEPGGNITGVASSAGAGLLSKHLELTKDALPSAMRVAILFNEANPLNYARASTPEIVAAAKAVDLDLLWLPVKASIDFGPAISAAAQQRADAIIGIGDPLLFSDRELVNNLAERNRIPVIWPTREYLAGRGLLSYGPTLQGLMRHATVYVDKMLRGVNPAITPVEQPTRYELVLNLKTARSLGLTIPPTLLARADEVIE